MNVGKYLYRVMSKSIYVSLIIINLQLRNYYVKCKCARAAGETMCTSGLTAILNINLLTDEGMSVGPWAMKQFN